MSGYNYNSTQPISGINTDVKPEHQPEGTYRFALNAVPYSDNDVEPFLTNEHSNSLIITYNNNDYDIIGHQYIGDKKHILFVVSKDNNLSGIIQFESGRPIIEIIPPCQELNLNRFYPVNSTSRKLHGCETVIYFTDNYNKPRYINLDKLDRYFDNSGNLIPEKLQLIDDYDIPNLVIEVKEGGGKLYAGSYNVAIQYLNEDLNGTNWVTISDVVNVYSDSFGKYYHDITGSYNKSDDEVYNTLFEEKMCLKSIKVTINHKGNVGKFKYFRLAYIIARTGTGLITEVLASKEYLISNTGFDNIIFTGNSEDYSKITKEEIFVDKVDIDTVKFIKQHDNRLLLFNGKGKQVDYCSFQRYASQIKADYRVDHVDPFKISGNRVATNITNSKDNVSIRMGFMGGEVYAFGIVYIFKDGTKSPVYHIPGRPQNMPTNPSNMDYYEVVNNVYENKPTISGQDYWGQDYWGNNLTGTKIRHHKFPGRDEIPLVTYNGNNGKSRYFEYTVRSYGDGLGSLSSSDFPLRYSIEYTNNDVDYSINIYVEYDPDIITNKEIPPHRF